MQKALVLLSTMLLVCLIATSCANASKIPQELQTELDNYFEIIASIQPGIREAKISSAEKVANPQQGAAEGWCLVIDRPDADQAAVYTHFFAQKIGGSWLVAPQHGTFGQSTFEQNGCSNW